MARRAKRQAPRVSTPAIPSSGRIKHKNARNEDPTTNCVGSFLPSGRCIASPILSPRSSPFYPPLLWRELSTMSPEFMKIPQFVPGASPCSFTSSSTARQYRHWSLRPRVRSHRFLNPGHLARRTGRVLLRGAPSC